MNKLNKLKLLNKTFIAVLLLCGLFANAQVSSALSNQTGEITGVIKTITSWVTAIIGLVALIQAILIFTSSQGTGEEKIKKAGTWIFMVVFCAVGFVIVKALFP